MLRGDLIICGTSTTGTGTLTLAATPVPPGGVDFDVFARATGLASSATILTSYTIIEYTDSTFATAKAHEKGLGLLTLGSSSGIANATLARTNKQTSATSLNSQPATQNFSPATGISIGTAANTLVFIGPSVSDTMAYDPYVLATGNDAKGAVPLGQYFGGVASSGGTQTSGVHSYMPFMWGVPMLVKSCTLIQGSAHTLTGGTNNAYARIYAKGTDGRPGKLMYNFGSATITSTASAFLKIGGGGSGLLLMPGEYYLDVNAIFTGVEIFSEYWSMLAGRRVPGSWNERWIASD
jgi:hypothetical protein